MALLIFANVSIGGPYVGASTAAFCLMCLGIYYRRTVHMHQRFMLFAICLDILIVLLLEATRGAVETTLFKSLHWTQYVHISASLIAVLLYFAQMIFGFKLKKNPAHPGLRNLHRNLGITCFTFRSIGFAFMYSMATK